MCNTVRTSSAAGHDDNSMRVTVDCTSKPSYAYLTISGITEDVFFMAVFYSCNIGNETVGDSKNCVQT